LRRRTENTSKNAFEERRSQNLRILKQRESFAKLKVSFC